MPKVVGNRTYMSLAVTAALLVGGSVASHFGDAATATLCQELAKAGGLAAIGFLKMGQPK